MNVIPETIKTTLKKLVLYPFAIFICWVFNTLTTLYFTAGGEHNPVWEMIAIIGTILGVCQGLAFALIFFTMNPLVRYHWFLLFNQKVFNLFSVNNEETIENDETTKLWELQQVKIRSEIDYIPSLDLTNNQFSTDNCTNKRSSLSFSDRFSRLSAIFFNNSMGSNGLNDSIQLSTIGNALHFEEDKKNDMNGF